MLITTAALAFGCMPGKSNDLDLGVQITYSGLGVPDDDLAMYSEMIIRPDGAGKIGRYYAVIPEFSTSSGVKKNDFLLSQKEADALKKLISLISKEEMLLFNTSYINQEDPSVCIKGKRSDVAFFWKDGERIEKIKTISFCIINDLPLELKMIVEELNGIAVSHGAGK